MDYAHIALALALVSAGVVRLMIAFPILDHPNARSAHARPTPRGGGTSSASWRVSCWRRRFSRSLRPPARAMPLRGELMDGEWPGIGSAGTA